MPQPDYEDDLVFPPQERLAELSKTVEKLSSENQRLLNLNAGKESELKELENKLAIATDILVHLRGIFLSPDSIDSNYDFTLFLSRIDKALLDIYHQKVEGQNDDIVEVIAPCDYKEVKRLNKIIKNVLESNEALAGNINELSRKIEAYQLSEKEAQEIIAELDYKNEQFRQLLKECSEYLGTFVIKSEIRDSLISKLCEVLK